jgi:hypothetical protein
VVSGVNRTPGADVAAAGGDLADLPVHRASRSSTALATPLANGPVGQAPICTRCQVLVVQVAPKSGLVVSIVPVRAEVHLRQGSDTMCRRSSTQRPGRYVVCFVVLIVVAVGDVRVLGAEVASGPVLVHVQPPSMGA